MKVIKPTKPLTSMLVSTTLVNPQPMWNDYTAYNVGDQVVYNYGVYQSLVAANTNNVPDTVNSTAWSYIKASNQWAALDGQSAVPSTATTSFQLVLNTGAIDTLAVVALDAPFVRVTVRNGAGGPVVYERLQGVTGAVGNWYEYFFTDPSLRRNQLLFTEIPPYGNSQVTIEVYGQSTVSVGEIVFGRIYTLGATQYGASAGITDYSGKEPDETFGTVNFVERGYSKRLSAVVEVSHTIFNRVQRLLTELRAVPTVYIASDDLRIEEAAFIYGFYKDFSTVIDYPDTSLLNIELEGLVL